MFKVVIFVCLFDHSSGTPLADLPQILIRELSRTTKVFLAFDNLTYTEKGNWVFDTNTNFQIPKALQPDGVNLWYFFTFIICYNKIHSTKCQRLAQSGCKDLGIWNFMFVTKTQFLDWKVIPSF